MTHPHPGDCVSLLGSFGTIEDVATCGWREFMCLVNFDDCAAHWCMARDLERITERPAFRPQLACIDGVDVRDTAPCEVTP